MSRLPQPYQAPDISVLARQLKRELDSRAQKPGHVELLNILAKAAGFRNYQHMRASQAAHERLAAEPSASEPVDYRRVEAAARCFDADGVLLRWPAKTVLQHLCLWKLWSLVPAEVDLAEREVNVLLKSLNRFGDHVLLRREMVNQRLLSRTQDCTRYRRIERRPPAEALALIRGRVAAAENSPLPSPPYKGEGLPA